MRRDEESTGDGNLEVRFTPGIPKGKPLSDQEIRDLNRDYFKLIGAVTGEEPDRLLDRYVERIHAEKIGRKRKKSLGTISLRRKKE